MKISVITVVYNGQSFLETTIQSVVAQTARRNIEYIVVDGNSNDGTHALIQQYRSAIDILLIEADKGLYDAMNKGLRLATGDFVWFVNAGDRIAEATTVEKMLACANAETDILYGEVAIVDENWQRLGTRSELTTQQLPDNLTWRSLRFGMTVSHQGFLPRTAITDEYIMNNLTADIDWVINCLKKSKKTVNTRQIIAEFQTGGISTQRKKQSLKDRYKVLSKHFGFFPNFAAHLWILARALFATKNR
jgi:glycosyltransferase involved in cell wall biosynthesis